MGVHQLWMVLGIPGAMLFAAGWILGNYYLLVIGGVMLAAAATGLSMPRPPGPPPDRR